MKLSIIMPIFNEEKTLLTILDRVKDVPLEKEIIIVDDCSTDGTRDLLKKIDSENILISYHDTNEGKGAAVRSGLQHVTGDIIIIQDGDLEYDPADFPKLVQPILDEKTDVVYGSRALAKSPISYRRYNLGAKFITWVANLLYGLNLTDLWTCYKVIKKDVIVSLDLKCQRFEFCPEVTAKLSRMGHSILELPISYHPRPFEEGKKIRWHDGLVGIWTLLRYRFWKGPEREMKRASS
ncbi:MAG: glycosyltransferase family 2 protein [Gemmatimonadota bacterium]|nr:MAG: glycosyltransferase family 2 protein [Gemmatimonadota bacterium]